MPARSGVLVIDKPPKMTSHDVVAKLRKRLATRAIGHAGTLDPMATGVLVVAIEEATKLVPYLTSEEKSYEAEVTFGRATDTLDAEGTVVAEGPVPDDLDARIVPALEAERARTSQVPPAYSAIHTDGERAHVRARRGESLELEARPVTAHAIDLAAVTRTTAVLRLRVSKGYYVRSLARDLGERVGAPAHLTALRRTASGSFTLEDACALDVADLDARILPLERAVACVMPTSKLSARGVADARAGRRVQPADMTVTSTETDVPVAWLDEGGKLVAIGCTDGTGAGRVLRGFAAG